MPSPRAFLAIGTTLTVLSCGVAPQPPPDAGAVDAGAVDAGTADAGSCAAPRLTSVSPSTGPTAGGTSVTLSGACFQAGLDVKFGTSSASAVTVQSATQATVLTPASAAGPSDVVVTNPDGTSGTLSAGFTFQ